MDEFASDSWPSPPHILKTSIFIYFDDLNSSIQSMILYHISINLSERPLLLTHYYLSIDILDAEEFLREIKREEAIKAAQLKQEIKEEQQRILEEEMKKSKKKSTKKKKKSKTKKTA